jgi:hypothetical protein
MSRTDCSGGHRQLLTLLISLGVLTGCQLTEVQLPSASVTMEALSLESDGAWVTALVDVRIDNTGDLGLFWWSCPTYLYRYTGSQWVPLFLPPCAGGPDIVIEPGESYSARVETGWSGVPLSGLFRVYLGGLTPRQPFPGGTVPDGWGASQPFAYEHGQARGNRLQSNPGLNLSP